MTATSETTSVQPAILVIASEQQCRATIEETLIRSGYSVMTATNRTEGLQYLEHHTPDLILSDSLIPNLDPFTCLVKIKTTSMAQAIPFIFLTDKGEKDESVIKFDMTKTDFIPLPLTTNDLMVHVQKKIGPPQYSETFFHEELIAKHHFLHKLKQKLVFAKTHKTTSCLAYLEISELDHIQEFYGTERRNQLEDEVVSLINTDMVDNEEVTISHHGVFTILLPETTNHAAKLRLTALLQRILQHSFKVQGERLWLSPAIGFTSSQTASTIQQMESQALAALDYATAHLEPEPLEYTSKMAALASEKAKKMRRDPWYVQLKDKLSLPFQIFVTFFLAFAAPFLVYYGMWKAFEIDLTPWTYAITVLLLVAKTSLTWVESFLAWHRQDPPKNPKEPYPAASIIIAAYLPNEAVTVVQTVKAFLNCDYPAPLKVILAYNTPVDMPVERTLRKLASQDARFVPLRVHGSASKAQNINAALMEVSGEFVGIFDADHRPHPGSLSRVWRWLSHGADVVQGHCVIRNGDASWVAEMVAVEFETMYALSHPGRARFHGFGIFGGSNGYWRTDVLLNYRSDPSMLTEDIDITMRVVRDGHKIISDPYLISEELAPTTFSALWNQRMRWCQGWFQVALRHTIPAMYSPHLTGRQKLALFDLLGWNNLFPWIGAQIVSILLFKIFIMGMGTWNWMILLFIFTTVLTLGTAPGQAMYTWWLAAPKIAKRRRWFLKYTFVTSLFFMEVKNIIVRVAQFKELINESKWMITPRHKDQ